MARPKTRNVTGFNLKGPINFTNGPLKINGTELSSAELAKLDGITASTAELNTLSGVTATAADLNKLASITGSPVVAKRLNFAETTGAGTYTGTVALPANAVLLDIIVHATSLWTATTSATLTVGDGATADGFYTGVNLKATDLLADESLSFAKAGGKEGAYITATHVTKRRDASARTISAVIVTVGAAGNGGSCSVTVIYSLPVSGDITSATKV